MASAVRVAMAMGLMLAACGGGDGAPVDAAVDGAGGEDAPAPDAAPDGAGDAAPDAPVDAGPIRVRITRFGTPVAGDDVLFHAPDGALLAQAVTDAQGAATGDVPDGSMVTVVRRGPPLWLRTVRDARRGDLLRFTGSERPRNDPLLTVALPPYSPLPPQYIYTADSHCAFVFATAENAPTLDLVTSCPPAARASVMGVIGVVPPGEAYRPIAFIEQRDVPLTPGSTVTLDGPWQPAVDQRVAVSGVPSFAYLGINKIWYRDGLPFYSQGRSYPVGTTTAIYPGAGGGDAWQARFTVCDDFGRIEGACQFWNRPMTDPLDLTADFEAVRMPWVGHADVTLGARTEVRWTPDGVQPYTATKVRVDVMGPELIEVFAEWTTYLPATMEATVVFTTPELPVDLAALWTEAGGADAVGQATIDLRRTDATYEQLRPRLFGPQIESYELGHTSVSRFPWWDAVDEYVLGEPVRR